MSAASHPPRYEAAYMDAGRGERWYVVTVPSWASTWDWRTHETTTEPPERSWISGGPFPTESDALAERGRRYAEIREFTREINEDARREGWTVVW